jgi:hypothetical protein
MVPEEEESNELFDRRERGDQGCLSRLTLISGNSNDGVATEGGTDRMDGKCITGTITWTIKIRRESMIQSCIQSMKDSA